MSRSQSLNFKKLVEAHYAGLYRFAYCLAANEQEACDLTQHTFFIYANHSASIRDEAKIKTWLLTTLFHEHQRQQRANQHPVIQKLAAVAATPEGVTALDGPRTAAILQQLDEIVRAPLALFYLQELSYAEIAAMLQIPLDELMSRLVRGKSQLKQHLLDHTRGD